jgi:hypothetical protein
MLRDVCWILLDSLHLIEGDYDDNAWFALNIASVVCCLLSLDWCGRRVVRWVLGCQIFKGRLTNLTRARGLGGTINERRFLNIVAWSE